MAARLTAAEVWYSPTRGRRERQEAWPTLSLERDEAFRRDGGETVGEEKAINVNISAVSDCDIFPILFYGSFSRISFTFTFGFSRSATHPPTQGLHPRGELHFNPRPSLRLRSSTDVMVRVRSCIAPLCFQLGHSLVWSHSHAYTHSEASLYKKQTGQRRNQILNLTAHNMRTGRMAVLATL